MADPERDRVPPATAVADVLALAGLDGSLSPPLRPLAGEGGQCAGRAVTVSIEAGTGPPGLQPLYEMLSNPLTGKVVVVDAAAIGSAVWGEILSVAAANSGAVGAVIAGFARDALEMAALGLPVWSLGEATVGPAGGVRVAAIDVPVPVSTSTVHPGDLLLIDAGGVVAVPRRFEEEVLQRASAYADAEARVLGRLAAGDKLSQAYVDKRDVVAALVDKGGFR